MASRSLLFPMSYVARLLLLVTLSGQLQVARTSECKSEQDGCSLDTDSNGYRIDTSALLQFHKDNGVAGIEKMPSESFFGEPNPPKWPHSVKIFSEDTPQLEMEFEIGAAWELNGKQPPTGAPHGQFSSKRFAFLFKPGKYSLDVPVGYYTQVLGLGEVPYEVVFENSKGPHVPCRYQSPGPGQLDTFWRSAENFKTEGNTVWAVSQAAPLRRVHVVQNLSLNEKGCYASGGYLGNSVVGGSVSGGGQQQWFTRSSDLGSWDGVGWNAVFAGVSMDAVQTKLQKELQGHVCGTTPFGPRQTVVVDEVALIAEKPFISVDPLDSRKFVLNVPEVHSKSRGVDWTTGTSYPFEKVYVTKPTDSARDINRKLRMGLHVVVTPAIYALDRPLRITHDDQVLLCLGLATLQSMRGTAVIEVMGDVQGVRIAGCLLEAGPLAAEELLHWGRGMREPRPSFLHDLFARVGGPTNNAAAKTMVRIDANNVIGDNLWLWRADHYDSRNYLWPIHDSRSLLGMVPCDHGLVVTGDDVTMYGLAIEHTLKDQVVWSGERGATYFFQCEIPYDVTSAYADAGYVGYRVDDHVSKHSLYGAGVYSYFRDHEVWMETAIKTPKHLQDSVVQPLVVRLSGFGGIKSIINGEGKGVQEPGGFQVAFLNNHCKLNYAADVPVDPQYLDGYIRGAAGLEASTASH